MPGPSRPRKKPIIIVGSHDKSSSSSSSEDEEEELEEEDSPDEEDEEKKKQGRNRPSLEKGGGKKAPAIIISLKKVCKVCKEEGHQAGFQGANYIDCPRKPCFLCKMPGHTTMSCPHRVSLEHGVVPAFRKNKQTQLDYVFERQLMCQIPKIKPTFVVPDKLDRGVVKFHSRRVTSLEFHPTMNSVLISGDKKGQIGIWDYNKPNEKTVYESIHSCIVNSMKFDTRNDVMLYTSSSDGTISYTDLETGIGVLLIDVNPDGWNGPSTWRMLYGMDTNSDKGLLLAADNFGYLYLSVFIWRLGSKAEDKETERKKEIIFCSTEKKSAKGKFNESDDDGDDGDDFFSKGKNKQQKKYGGKSDKAGSSKSKKLKT